MTVADIMSRMREIPYSVLEDFIDENLDCEEYRKFLDKSVRHMSSHDPKGFRIEYILRNILFGDYELIIDFLEKYGER